MDPERVVGVDFSAAKSDAGRRTWLAEARVVDDGLELDSLGDAATHLDCSPSRDATLAALVEELGGGGANRVVGLDFPFSLPAPFLDGDDWRTFVEATPERWGRLDADSPHALYEAATGLAAEEDLSLTRATDDVRGGQAPTGFRIKTQTFYGISAVLRRIDADVAVAPIDDAVDADPVVVETYPAALFDAVDGHRTGYKHDTRPSIDRRKTNVGRLEDEGVDFAGHADYAMATDDALDAVASMVAAWRAARADFATGDGWTDTDDRYAVEGYIYA